MKRKLFFSLILAAVLLALPALTACGSLGGSDDGVSVQQTEVTRGDLIINVTGNGSIQSANQAWMAFGGGGEVAAVNVSVGDSVAAGDVLAELNTNAMELACDQASLALAQAEGALMQANLALDTAEYNFQSTIDSEDALELAVLNAEIIRDAAQSAYDLAVLLGDTAQIELAEKQLEAAGLAVTVAQQQLDGLAGAIELQQAQVDAAAQAVIQAEMGVDLAQQSLDEAEQQLAEVTLTAPFDGIVASVLVEEGDVVPSASLAAQPVIQIIDPASLELLIEVDEIDIPLLDVGQEAEISVDALTDATFTGELTTIYPVPIVVSGVVLYSVEISLDVPADSGVMVGMSATADIVVETHEDVLLVPTRAVSTNTDGQTVVMVVEDGEAVERVVVTGLNNGLRTEIISGLEEGEIIEYEVRVSTTSGSLF